MRFITIKKRFFWYILAMKKRFFNYLNIKLKRRISREQLIANTSQYIAETKVKVAELRTGLLDAYGRDHEADITYYTGMLSNYQLSLNEYQSNLKALNSSEVEGRFSYERVRTRHIKQNRAKLPLDLVIEQAKRAYEQRIELAEKWLDNNFSAHQQMQRLLEGKNYAGCPIGNFEAVERSYQG